MGKRTAFNGQQVKRKCSEISKNVNLPVERFYTGNVIRIYLWNANRSKVFLPENGELNGWSTKRNIMGRDLNFASHNWGG